MLPFRLLFLFQRLVLKNVQLKIWNNKVQACEILLLQLQTQYTKCKYGVCLCIWRFFVREWSIFTLKKVDECSRWNALVELFDLYICVKPARFSGKFIPNPKCNFSNVQCAHQNNETLKYYIHIDATLHLNLLELK